MIPQRDRSRWPGRRPACPTLGGRELYRGGAGRAGQVQPGCRVRWWTGPGAVLEAWPYCPPGDDGQGGCGGYRQNESSRCEAPRPPNLAPAPGSGPCPSSEGLFLRTGHPGAHWGRPWARLVHCSRFFRAFSSSRPHRGPGVATSRSVRRWEVGCTGVRGRARCPSQERRF